MSVSIFVTQTKPPPPTPNPYHSSSIFDSITDRVNKHKWLHLMGINLFRCGWLARWDRRDGELKSFKHDIDIHIHLSIHWNLRKGYLWLEKVQWFQAWQRCYDFCWMLIQIKIGKQYYLSIVCWASKVKIIKCRFRIDLLNQSFVYLLFISLAWQYFLVCVYSNIIWLMRRKLE